MAAIMKCGQVCIDPGKLRHLIEIVAPVKERDDTGHEKEVWKTIAKCRAAIEPARTKDIWQAMQVQTTVTHLVTIRWRPGINGQMQVKFHGRTLNIVGEPINPLELNVVLELTCYEAN